MNKLKGVVGLMPIMAEVEGGGEEREGEGNGNIRYVM